MRRVELCLDLNASIAHALSLQQSGISGPQLCYPRVSDAKDRRLRIVPRPKITPVARMWLKYVELTTDGVRSLGNSTPLLHISKQTTFGKRHRARAGDDEMVENPHVD